MKAESVEAEAVEAKAVEAAWKSTASACLVWIHSVHSLIAVVAELNINKMPREKKQFNLLRNNIGLYSVTHYITLTTQLLAIPKCC